MKAGLQNACKNFIRSFWIPQRRKHNSKDHAALLKHPPGVPGKLKLCTNFRTFFICLNVIIALPTFVITFVTYSNILFSSNVFPSDIIVHVAHFSKNLLGKLKDVPWRDTTSLRTASNLQPWQLLLVKKQEVSKGIRTIGIAKYGGRRSSKRLCA